MDLVASRTIPNDNIYGLSKDDLATISSCIVAVCTNRLEQYTELIAANNVIDLWKSTRNRAWKWGFPVGLVLWIPLFAVIPLKYIGLWFPVTYISSSLTMHSIMLCRRKKECVSLCQTELATRAAKKTIKLIAENIESEEFTSNTLPKKYTSISQLEAEKTLYNTYKNSINKMTQIYIESHRYWSNIVKDQQTLKRSVLIFLKNMSSEALNSQPSYPLANEKTPLHLRIN